MHMEEMSGLRERVDEAEKRHVHAQQRVGSGAGTGSGINGRMAAGTGIRADSKEKYQSVAMEHTLLAQTNQLQLQLEASHQRAQLLEHRLQERQVITAFACMYQ